MKNSAKTLFNKMKSLLDKESHVPVANMLMPDDAAEKITDNWVYRSWSELVNVDLVQKGDTLNYRRVLKDAKNNLLPELKENLEKNIYSDIILDLVNQQMDEHKADGESNALYILEMALELSRLSRGNAVHIHLLNMIHLHREKYGSIELLRQEELPEDKVRRERFDEMEQLTEGTTQPQLLPSDDIEATLNQGAKRNLKETQMDLKRGDLSVIPKFTNIKHLQQSDDLTDSQILATGLMLEALKKEELEEETKKIADMNPKDVERKARASLVRHWRDLEKKINIRVSSRLNDSRKMKELKAALWERQQNAERILEFTEQANHDNEMLQSFHKEMMLIKPVFRSEMGKKISGRPEVAEKIYNILDILAENEISAFDYLDIAIALAKTPYEAAVNIVECDVMNRGGPLPSPEAIVSAIDKYEDKFKGLPEISANGVSERQNLMWETGRG